MMNDFIHYLIAKKTVDDRALNKGVWDSMAAWVRERGNLKIIEVGGGIGTMLTRLLEAEIFPNIEYTLVDQSEANIIYAVEYLKGWGEENGFPVKRLREGQLRIEISDIVVNVNLIPSDINRFIAENKIKHDLIIGHAFLDLLDIHQVMPELFSLVRPGGAFYFTINYDGATIFEPVWDSDLENLILSKYNQTMDERMVNGKYSGDSQTGRHLFQVLKNNKGLIRNSGSSDWIVFPRKDGYIKDEKFFLKFITDTIHQALSENSDVDARLINQWVQKRHRQIDNSDLVYIAHQLDFFGVITR